jgi:type IV pilus assembly protein PilW
MKSSTHPLVNIPTLSAIKAKPSLQLGLSLIELMISITIGLLILVALSTLFINQSKARVELDKSNRMIDNGRYALDLLSNNLRLAGYYGEFAPASGIPVIPASLPDPCSTLASDMAAALQLAVQAYDAATPTSSISSPPCGLTYTAGNEQLTMKPGSDILVIRRVSTASIVQGVAVSGAYYLQASQCQYDLAPYKIDTIPANFTLRQKTCTATSTTPYADLRQFVVQVYFVSPNNKVIGGVGDGIPTLKRRELDPATNVFVTTPLVEGIEFMQLEYGLDVNNDGVADSYVAAPAATDWPNVVAVKLYILARNTEATKSYADTKTYSLGLVAGSVPAPNDPYKRHAYTQYIRLVNVAGRREVQ